MIDYDEPVLWELHFWAQTYERSRLEHNVRVVEALNKKARSDHESTVGRLAVENLCKLDRLQARTLHGLPFGHRCIRGISLDSPEEALARVPAPSGPIPAIDIEPDVPPPLPVAAC